MPKSNPLGLAIGSRVWVFGRNDTPSLMSVRSETSRSWVLSDGTKVPKSYTSTVFEVFPSLGPTRRYYLTREAANIALLHRMRWKMGGRVRECGDADILRTVAAALGMPVEVE